MALAEFGFDTRFTRKRGIIENRAFALCFSRVVEPPVLRACVLDMRGDCIWYLRGVESRIRSRIWGSLDSRAHTRGYWRKEREGCILSLIGDRFRWNKIISSMSSTCPTRCHYPFEDPTDGSSWKAKWSQKGSKCKISESVRTLIFYAPNRASSIVEGYLRTLPLREGPQSK